jgi:hypothetical protein
MENGAKHPDVELRLSLACYGSAFARNLYAWPAGRIAQANVQGFPRPRDSLAPIQHGRARLHCWHASPPIPSHPTRRCYSTSICNPRCSQNTANWSHSSFAPAISRCRARLTGLVEPDPRCPFRQIAHGLNYLYVRKRSMAG